MMSEEEKTKKLLDMVSGVVWFYHNGTNRCIGCGEYSWKGSHEPGCLREELLRRIKENKEK